MFRVALVSTPWPLLRRPSIQIGTLKAYLLQQDRHLQVDGYPLYLDAAQAVGPEIYQKLSYDPWIAEAVYSALLQPERVDEIHSFFERLKRKRKQKDIPALVRLLSPLQRAHDKVLEAIAESRHDLLGVSISLSQLTSSIYFIKAMKKIRPDVKIVVGGTSCAGELGKSLLAAGIGLDFVVDGEGEKPLLGLIRYLKEGGESFPPGVWGMKKNRLVGGGCNQVEDLNELPIPDYSDYFKRLRTLSRVKGLIPQLPLEMSRGCWWCAASGKAVEGGCRFCNLNLQWNGFRRKSSSRIIEEVERLSRAWECLDFFFTDNSLQVAPVNNALEKLAGRNMDLRFFGELRVPVSGAALKSLRSRGMDRVQVGIEALSTSMLTKMNKGSTALHNLKIMRDCEEAGIVNEANLIMGFPGSTNEQVKETLDNIQFALCYFPLSPVFFWLGHGSHVERFPGIYGISRIHNHNFYRVILPRYLNSRLVLMSKSYTGDRTHQKTIWKPVRRSLEQWRKDYFQTREVHPGRPLLGCRDGGTFLQITRRYADKSSEIHRLRGTSRQIYLHCMIPRSLDQLARRFPKFPRTAIHGFLNDLVDKRLVFRERDHFLSLAVRENT